MEINGRCHCGNIEWKTSFPDGSMPEKTICHCNACKCFGGGCYSVNMVVPKDGVDITKGKGTERIYTYIGQSGKDVDCYFCPNCTTHVFHHQKVSPDKLVMRPGLWDNEAAQKAKIVREVFARHRCPFQPMICGAIVED
ncbi:Mss4-like protein [Tuber indicum]|nr:Mss4-like protein [Tuber indicum]